MYFMVERDRNCMEVVESRVQWMPPMGYEVDPFIIVHYVDIILVLKKIP